MKKLFLFLTAALFATSMWAYNGSNTVTPAGTLTLPIVMDASTYTAAKGFASVAGSNDTTISVMHCSILSKATSTHNWVGASASNTNSSAWSDAPSPFKGSTYYSNTNRFTARDSRVLTFRVTNCGRISLYGFAASDSKTLDIAAWEVDGEGNVAASTTFKKSCTSTSYTVTSIAGLNPSSTYVVEITSNNSSNCMAAEIAFYSPAPATYTVTINPNGGSYASTPTGWTLTDGKYTKSGLNGSFNVPDGLTKTNYDLNGWKDTLGNSITLPFTLSKDTTLVAQWVEHATSSDATLSALSVAGCTLNETFDPDEEDYTIDLPFYASMPVAGDVTATKNDPYAEDPEISVAGNVITIACEAESGATKTYTITVTIASAPAASSSVNIEQNILDNGLSWDYATALSTANIQYTQPDALDSLNDSKGNRNYAFLGLKMAKNTNATMSIYIAKGSTLRVRFGNVQNMTTFKVTINGIETSLKDATLANSKVSDANVYEHTATANAGELVVFTSLTDKALVYKQIMIDEAIAAVTLPSVPTSIDNTADEAKAVKFIENGMLVIEKNGVRYNAQGQVIR